MAGEEELAELPATRERKNVTKQAAGREAED